MSNDGTFAASSQVQLPTEGIEASQVSGVLEMQEEEHAFGPDTPLRIPLPHCLAHSTLKLKLWLRAGQAGKLKLLLNVLCPARVTAMLDVAVEDPWEHKCRCA